MSETENQDLKEKNLKEWLANLQRESWQLELIVSGFSIFLLIAGSELIADIFAQIRYNPSSNFTLNVILSLVIGFAFISTKAMTFNLLIHLFLRGLWIGMIGLQSVTHKINYEKLNYDNVFEKFLKPRYESLESGIILLDKIASLIFSFTFLMIFCFFSFVLYILFAFSLDGILEFFFGKIGGYSLFVDIFSYFTLFIGIVYAFDFLSGGLIKSIKGRFAKIYYPIYRFLGWLTLSFLYRGLYYSLVSNLNRAVIGICFVVYLLAMNTLDDINISNQPYHLMDAQVSSIHSNFYDDERKNGDPVEKVAIPSKFYSKKYLPLFIRHWSSDNIILRVICPKFKTTKKEGLHFGPNHPLKLDYNHLLTSEHNFLYNHDKIDSTLLCNMLMFDIYMNDELLQDQEFYFTKHPADDELGFTTMIDISDYPSGKNLIKIEKLGQKNALITRFGLENEDSLANSLEKKEYAYVHFWK